MYNVFLWSMHISQTENETCFVLFCFSFLLADSIFFFLALFLPFFSPLLLLLAFALHILSDSRKKFEFRFNEPFHHQFYTKN